MTQPLYEAMALPDTCYLGKRVFKKLFFENARLGTADKRAFREDIEVILWQYTLKPVTIPIPVYEDAQREYHEIAVLQLNLKTAKRTRRLAEVVHRVIPYPLVVVFAYDALCALSLAHKRFSQAEKEAVVAEEIRLTEWFDLAAPTAIQQAFLDSLALPGLPQNHFLALYTALMDRLMALDCAGRTGRYQVESSAKTNQTRREYLAQCHYLENQIAEQRATIGKETRFNRQVELNTKIKNLEKKLQTITARL